MEKRNRSGTISSDKEKADCTESERNWKEAGRSGMCRELKG